MLLKDKMLKQKGRMVLFGLIMLISIILISNIVSALMCETAQTKNILRKALFDYLPSPELSKLNVSEMKDMLDFYLNSSNLTMVKCDIKATLSNTNYDSLINKFSNLTTNITIPSCSDGTPYGECSATKPKYCFAGQLVNRCRLCGGCPAGQYCKIDETAEFTIHEGVWGRCVSENIICETDADCFNSSVSYVSTSYFCENNNVYRAQNSYVCVNPRTINSYCSPISTNFTMPVDECDINKDEYCFYGFNKCQLACPDKTKYETCSSIKPKYCDNGILTDNCQSCGCSGHTCYYNGTCINILEKEKTLTFGSAEEQTVFLKIHKDMDIKNAKMDLTSITIFSSLDIGNDGIHEWNSSVYNIHREPVGFCSNLIYLNGGKLGVVWRGGFPNIVKIFPLGGRINSVTIDNAHILINPDTDIIMDNLQLDFINGELKGMNVTMDVSICKIDEKNVASVCSSSPVQLFRDYSLSDIPTDWTNIPLKNEVVLTSGFWKIMFTMHYPNPSILPSNAGVGIRMCGYQETGEVLFTNLDGREYYENGSVSIQLVNQETSDFINPIIDYLNTCAPDPEGNCLVPLIFRSDSVGVIKISNVFITNQTICSDKTPYNQCSLTKPLYCSNGSLINNCQSCGCPYGKKCGVDGTCEEYYIITTLSDGSSEKTLIFNETGNQTVHIRIPKEAKIINATLEINHTTIVSLDVGSDGDIEWTSNEINKMQIIPDFSVAIENYLATCIPDSEGNCLVALNFYSEVPIIKAKKRQSIGIIKISNINIIDPNSEEKLSFFEKIGSFIKRLFG